MDVLLVALAVQVLSGGAALLFSRQPRTATVLGAGGAVAGCLLGLIPTLRILLNGTPESLDVAWDAAHGAFRVEVDALSAFFLVPVLVLSALAAVYGGNYLLAYRREKALGPPWFFFNLFVAGMVLVLLARTVLLFLVAWEVMSLAAYCLVTFEHEKAEVRHAGWVYLIATHVGVAFLLFAFAILARQADGKMDFEAFRTMPLRATGWEGVVFVLALIGFGTKAGFMPLHVWLPEAHPAAPSHVSALMSGVMIKMGLYGLLRVLTFLGPPAPWWGPTLGAVGLFTALLGIALALQQRDIKRVLAYSSIENMGLIGLSLGVGLWGWATAAPTVAVLGVMAALLHIWNHALMKGLLFLAAGSVLHGTGTKDMEQLGGLMKRMPWTASAMIAGAVALSALPPLNGFVSKWLIYLGLLKCGLADSAGRSLTALLAIGVLAHVGGLAVITYVRLTGVVLLGSPRSQHAAHAHESSPWLLGPMLVLVALCVTMAVLPSWVTVPLLGPLEQLLGRGAGATWTNLEATAAPLYMIGNVNGWTWLTLGAAALLLGLLLRRGVAAPEPTWGCGYVRPTERMQYTGRSFTEMFAEHVLPPFMRPRTRRQEPRGLFPGKSDFAAATPDPVSEQVYEPFFRRLAKRCLRLRILQQGKVHIYLIYIVVVVVAALAWGSLRQWLGAS
jgi:formate hydrogenlyase subunit 3/multisubunit Na+/H+ antiporter MnhD subunit